MDAQKIVTQCRLSEWGELIKERIACGQSVSEFCMERGISENAYYYRLRKIREAACEQIADAQKKSKALIPSGWAELVEIEAGSAQESCLTVEIGGCQIIVNNETDTALLKKVCGVLKTL